jgi:hypothetical protein
VTRRFGCCSGCLLLFALLLIVSSWMRSSWPERALELLIAAALLVIVGAFQARHTLRPGGKRP